jgi:hypothetical protein
VGETFTGSAGATTSKAPSKLVYFGLLEADGTRGEQTAHRITPLGEAFLRGTTAVPDRSGPRGAAAQGVRAARQPTSTKSPPITPRATGQGTSRDTRHDL